MTIDEPDRNIEAPELEYVNESYLTSTLDERIVELDKKGHRLLETVRKIRTGRMKKQWQAEKLEELIVLAGAGATFEEVLEWLDREYAELTNGSNHEHKANTR